MAWCSQRREYPQTPARYRLSRRRAAQGTQQNLIRSCKQSDTVHGLWKPASIRKQSANSGNFFEENLNGCKSTRKHLKNWRTCSVVTRYKPSSIPRGTRAPRGRVSDGTGSHSHAAEAWWKGVASCAVRQSKPHRHRETVQPNEARSLGGWFWLQEVSPVPVRDTV